MSWAAAIAERVTRGQVVPRFSEARVPGRYGGGTGHKTCSVCGQVGHQRNSAIHRTPPAGADPAPSAPPPVPATAPAPRPPPARHCSICGEAGHRADGPRHRQGSAQPANAASAPPPTRAAPALDPGPPAIRPGPDLDELPAPAAPAEPAPAPPLADPSDDDAFVPEVVARARARHYETATGRVRAKTIAGDHLTRVERRAAGLVVYPEDVERPRTRGDCASMPRPCPFVSCANHLYLDVNEETGAIKLNFPHLEVWQMAETCSLDVADRGGTTLEEVGALTNVTRERVRQIETRAVSRLRHAAPELAQEDATPDTIRSVEDRLAWL